MPLPFLRLNKLRDSFYQVGLDIPPIGYEKTFLYPRPDELGTYHTVYKSNEKSLGLHN